MPVPSLITDLSTTAATNSPAGSENVFPSLDDYLRAQSAFLASVRDNSGNGWVSPYLPLSGGTMTGSVSGFTATTGTFSGNVQMASANGGQLAGLRNKIINGSFTVNQRGITTTTPLTGAYTVDQWQAVQSVAGKFSISTGSASSTAVAAGASGNTLTATTLVAYTPLASEVFCILHKIEGLNIADLAWGTASAKTVTLSFYATSSLTGTFGGTIRNGANTRSYPFTYSIPVASTPTRISITIPGDTTGAFTDWVTTTSLGMSILFSYGTGPTASGTAGSWAAVGYTGATGANSLVSNAGATLTHYNVQLEVGPVATPFEQRPIGMELALCQRYYEIGSARFDGYAAAAAQGIGYQHAFKATKRAVPTLTYGSVSVVNASTFDARLPATDSLYWYAAATAAGAVTWSGNWTATAEL
jgi:hypothetical protein